MNNNAKELLKLMTENPSLPVTPMVSYEVCIEDSTNYWMGSIGKCKLGKLAIFNDKVFDDEEDLKEEYFECDDYDNYSLMTEDEIEKDLEEKTKDMWVECIIVYIELPEEVINE